jgi:zinc finger protein
MVSLNRLATGKKMVNMSSEDEVASICPSCNKGKLRILPEWGIDVEPGPTAESFITNIEGILYRVRMVVETARKFADLEVEKARATEILVEMKAALRGEFSFTLVMEDPAGVSGILPDDMTLVKYEELTIEEASKLKGDPFWVDTLREDYSERKG